MGRKKRVKKYYYLPFKYDIANNKFVKLSREELRKLKAGKNG
jgi:hypothetical protein